MKKIHDQIVKGIQKYFRESGYENAVIGLSGGIDSSLTLKLAVDALGAEHVTGLLMPENGISSDENTYHAKALAEFFNIKTFIVTINKFLIDFGLLPWRANKLAAMNIKARIRMLLLYHYANTHYCLVLGTSNKSEIMLGYGTKFGDFASDIEVIGSLYKEDVYRLARYLEIPDEIINKKPTAELTPGQTDEEELGASYHELDQILKKYTMGVEGLLERGMHPGLVHGIIRRIEQNKHKTTPAPIIKVKDLDNE